MYSMYNTNVSQSIFFFAIFWLASQRLVTVYLLVTCFWLIIGVIIYLVFESDVSVEAIGHVDNFVSSSQHFIVEMDRQQMDDGLKRARRKVFLFFFPISSLIDWQLGEVVALKRVAQVSDRFNSLSVSSFFSFAILFFFIFLIETFSRRRHRRRQERIELSVFSLSFDHLLKHRHISKENWKAPDRRPLSCAHARRPRDWRRFGRVKSVYTVSTQFAAPLLWPSALANSVFRLGLGRRQGRRDRVCVRVGSGILGVVDDDSQSPDAQHSP